MTDLPKNPGEKLGEAHLVLAGFPISPTPEKGDSSQKFPIFPVVPCIEMGMFFDSKLPSLGSGRDGFFLAPKPSFPDFGTRTVRTDWQQQCANWVH